MIFNMAKILVIEHYFLTPHFETGVELAIENKMKSNNVLYIYLKQFYPTLLVPYHLKLSFIKNIQYLKKRESSIKKNLFRIKKRFDITFEFISNKNILIFFKALKYSIFHPLSIEKISVYRYNNVNLGISALSTYISNIGDDQPNIKFSLIRLKKILFESVIAFELTQNLIVKHKPDLVYVFNGRFNVDNAIVKSCQLNGVEIILHERGCNFHKYEVFEWPLHSFYNINKQINEYYLKKTITNIEYHNIANSFFQQNRNGKDLHWLSFNSNFKKTNIKRTNKIRYVYFSSSDDEFSHIEFLKEDKQPLFTNQRECIKYLIQYFSFQKDRELIIRVHPHKNKKAIELKNFWNNLSGENITVIKSYSDIDSYQLIEESDVVLSYGTTVGIESTYWGKPSILLGSSYYMFLNCTFNPQNIEELNELLHTSNKLNAFPVESTYKFGYYMMTFGKKFNYYKPKNFFEGELIL